jgi:branched-chain amino acid transport system substrate-binding protein
LDAWRRRIGLLVAVGLVATTAACGTRLSHDEILTAGGPADAGAAGASGLAAGSDQSGAAQSGAGDSSAAAGDLSAGDTGAATAAGAAGGAASGGAAGGSAGEGSGGGASGAVAATGATGGVPPILGGNAPCSPATKSEVNIGNVSTLSGVLGLLFSPVVPAINTFVKATNDCGGLNGHKIKLFVSDDQGDPSTATTVAKRQIQDNKILAFLGNIQVLTIDGMVGLINETKIPIVGGDLTNNTWFSSPYIFPQGSAPAAVSIGYLQAATQVYKQTDVGNVWCLEVPQACTQIDKAFREHAGKFGATVRSSIQISITAPSYTSQCLQAQDAGVKVMALTVDAPTQNRYADSCAKVGFKPQYVAYPLGVGNEEQFLGNPNLANTYVPLQTFPWMSSGTPAMKYYQDSVKRYNPGAVQGYASSLGWTAGAMLVQASKFLSDTPTTAELLKGLWTFKGGPETTLGGLTAPLTFAEGQLPKAPFCLFAAVSNKDNSGWASTVDKPVCQPAL